MTRAMSVGLAVLLSFATLAQSPAGQQPKPAKAKLNAGEALEACRVELHKLAGK